MWGRMVSCGRVAAARGGRPRNAADCQPAPQSDFQRSGAQVCPQVLRVGRPGGGLREALAKLGHEDACAQKMVTGTSVHAQKTLGTEEPTTVFAIGRAERRITRYRADASLETRSRRGRPPYASSSPLVARQGHEALPCGRGLVALVAPFL